MAVPKFDTLMLPLLQSINDGADHTVADVVPRLADALHLSDADRNEEIKPGLPRLRNRVYWAKLYLSQAGAIVSVRPGTFQITERGKDLLNRELTAITPDVLMEFEEYRTFRAKSRRRKTETMTARAIDDESSRETPQEELHAAYLDLKSAVVRELLEAVRAASPSFLESLMVQLLVRMGYGDGDDSGIVLGGVHDGGVDGVVKKDRLGLSSIYIQAKRYKDGSPVGAPAIQQFAGSMQERRAEEGVFVTTSTFTREAQESVKKLHARIALIDGQRLSELMFELGIGVVDESNLTLKRIDPDFFAER